MQYCFSPRQSSSHARIITCSHFTGERERLRIVKWLTQSYTASGQVPDFRTRVLSTVLCYEVMVFTFNLLAFFLKNLNIDITLTVFKTRTNDKKGLQRTVLGCKTCGLCRIDIRYVFVPLPVIPFGRKGSRLFLLLCFS